MSAAPAASRKGAFPITAVILVSFWKYTLFRLLMALPRHVFMVKANNKSGLYGTPLTDHVLLFAYCSI